MKKLLALILVLSVVVCFCGCQPKVENDGSQKTFTVTVVHKDGTSKDFTYTSDKTYVGEVLQQEGLIAGNMGQYGLEIHTVDGEKAVYTEDKAYWAIYEGEEYALQGIDATPIKDGGVYKLVYTLA